MFSGMTPDVTQEPSSREPEPVSNEPQPQIDRDWETVKENY